MLVVLGWLALNRSMTTVILRAMKTAVSLPDPLFRDADRAAKRLGISRSELYARALAEFLRRESEVTLALDKVYAREDSKIDPVLGALQRRATAEEW